MPIVRFYGLRFVDIQAGNGAMGLPVGWGNATVDYSIKLLAPAVGSSLVARGTAVSAGRTLSVGEAKVFTEGGYQVPWIATVRNFAAAARP
jgi:acyl-coenzyme A thioesterase PaaI-like protein